MGRLWHIHTKEYYVSIETNELGLFRGQLEIKNFFFF